MNTKIINFMLPTSKIFCSCLIIWQSDKALGIILGSSHLVFSISLLSVLPDNFRGFPESLQAALKIVPLNYDYFSPRNLKVGTPSLTISVLRMQIFVLPFNL
jgi:hypothetical protein